MKILKYIDEIIAKMERWFIIAFLSLMVILTFFRVILRALYTHGHFQWANEILSQVDWTEPFVRLTVLWITFLGASLLTGDNRHIKIDLFGSLMPSKWLSVREIILSIVCILICALMLNASLGLIRIEMEFGTNYFLGIPAWVCQLILPLGFFVILFRFFIMALEHFINVFGSVGS